MACGILVPQPGIEPRPLAGKTQSPNHWNIREFPIFGFLKHLSIPKVAATAKSLQSCLTLRDPIDGSPPGYPVPGTLQAKTLEWVAISFSNA